MPTQTSSLPPDRTKSSTSEKSSSPVPEKDPASSSEESAQGPIDSPSIQTQSPSPTNSDRGDQRLEIPSSGISNTSLFSWQGESPSQICLCQPDPKIPRPRNGMLTCYSPMLIVKTGQFSFMNRWPFSLFSRMTVTNLQIAFILYRQHHQAAVVAQNPGLANPEISKVIGDHWRQSPEEVKGHWKKLAEVSRSTFMIVTSFSKSKLRRKRNFDIKNNTLVINTNLVGAGEATACPTLSHRPAPATPKIAGAQSAEVEALPHRRILRLIRFTALPRPRFSRPISPLQPQPPAAAPTAFSKASTARALTGPREFALDLPRPPRII